MYIIYLSDVQSHFNKNKARFSGCVSWIRSTAFQSYGNRGWGGVGVDRHRAKMGQQESEAVILGFSHCPQQLLVTVSLLIWLLESKLGVDSELIFLLDWTEPIRTLKLNQIPFDSRQLWAPRFRLHPTTKRKTRPAVPLRVCWLGTKKWLPCLAIVGFRWSLLPLNSALRHANCDIKTKCLEWEINLSTSICLGCPPPRWVAQAHQESRFPRHKGKWCFLFTAFLSSTWGSNVRFVTFRCFKTRWLASSGL